MAKKEEENNAMVTAVIDGALGAVLGMAVTLVLLYVFAVLITSGKIPESFSEEAIIVSAFLGSAAGGIMTAKKHGRRHLIAALLCGAGYILILIVFAALGKGEYIQGVLTVKLCAAALIGSGFGGFLASGIGKQKKYY